MDISFVLRKFRKSISGFTILALLTTFVSFVGVAQAATFDDIDGHWGEAYIEALYDAGVVSGNDDGTFNPDGTLLRAELAKMLVLAYTEGLDEDAAAVYSDVSEADWFYAYANDAYQKGIMTGEADGSFNGGGMVNRATLMQAVYNAAGLTATGEDLPFSDVMSSDWFYDAVDAGYWWSIVDGTSETTFSPSDYATRAAASKVIYNGWYPVEREAISIDPEVVCEDGYELDAYDDCVEVTEPSSEGTLLISLASDTPDSATVPARATSVELVAYDLTAEDDDVNFDGVTVNQYGVSSMYSNHSVYAYAEIDGVNTRLSSGQSINSSTHDVTFNNLDLEVEEGETVRFSIRMDVGGNASSSSNSTKEVGLQIESADMVDVDGADVSGNFDSLMGGLFSIATDVAGTITIEKNGTITNPQVGEDGVTIAKFKLSAANEAAQLQELGLYISGTVNTLDVTSYELFISGEDEAIATADAVDSLDVVRFEIDDYILEKGGTKSATVVANMDTGRTGDTVLVYVDEDTDLLATGDLYGYGMSVTRSDYDGASCTSALSYADCSSSTLEGGDVTISSNGPAATDVAINGNDVTLLSFDLTTVTDVTIKNFPISLTVPESGGVNSGLLNDTTGVANITDIRIVDTETGEEVFSAVDSDAMTSDRYSTAITTSNDEAIAYHLFTDDLTLVAGEELNLAIVADVENNSALSGDTITATLDLGSSYPEMRDINNKVLSNASVLVPASAVTGKTHTLRSASLSVALASTPVSDTHVKGSSDVNFTGVVFTCGDASTCLVTDLIFSGALDDDANGGFETSSTTTVDASDNGTALNAYVGSIWLVDAEGNTVAGPESVNGTSFTSTFTNVDWSLDAGATEILYVVGDLSNDSYANADGEAIAFGITGSTQVTSEDQDGNAITASGSANTSQTTVVTTSEGGSLTISVDGSKPNEDIVVAGTSDVNVSSFEFQSTDEPFLVTDLTLVARSSGISSSLVPGDYDNNVSSVTLSYLNSEGETEEATGFLTNGAATFTGLDFYIDADEDETLEVYVDLNTIEAGASATEFVELNVGLNNFEAIAQGSGETYTSAKIDRDTADASDLDFGTLSFTDTNDLVLAAAVTGVDAGDTITFTFDDGNGASTDSPVLPVGTVVCLDISVTETSDDDGGNAASCDQSTDITGDTLFVVTSVSDGATTDSYTGFVLQTEDADDADVTVADNTVASYAVPGDGFLTGTERMHVQETVPTVALSSTSPSGSQSVSATAQPFIIDVTADEGQDVVLRGAVYLDGETDLDVELTGADGELTVSSTQNLTNGGSSSLRLNITDTADNDCWFLDTGSDLSAYANVSGWYFAFDDATTGDTFGASSYSFATDTDGLTAADDEVAFAASGNLIEGAWTFVDSPIAPNSGAQYAGFCATGTDLGGSDAGDFVYLDEIKFYNEKITLDISGALDGSDGAQGLHVKMKNGSTTEADGYIDQTSASAATVVLIPTTSQGDIEVGEGETETYAFETSTTTLVGTTSGDDFVTISMDMGTSTDGSITAGDFWWYDDNETVKWLGDVSNTTLNGNTLTY